ncbi:Shr3 amino acid permease chaperone, partial [Peziza echinospora]
MGRAQFGTFLIICPVSFFLGILFTNLSFDYHTLWTSVPATETILAAVESHYTLLNNPPPLIPRVLNFTVILGLAGFLCKLVLYNPTESNYLFDGASLVLYMIGFVMYATNIIQGLSIVASGDYGEEVGKIDTLKIMAATQTMIALVFLGVLVLQAGQWYAEGKEAEEAKRIEAEVQKEKLDAAGAGKKK